MNRDWTIDTYVLYKAADVDYDAVEFINRILRERHRVTFDYKRHIEVEYESCLKKVQKERKDGSRALKIWFKAVVGKFAQKYSGDLQKKHRAKFSNELRLDPSDWPFVAVCARTASKRLVSEDSDYSEKIREYLQKEMKINVLSIQESLEIQ